MLGFLTPRGAQGKEYSYYFETLFIQGEKRELIIPIAF